MIPENPREAILLRKNPCNYCNHGWSVYTETKISSCKEKCKYFDIYWGEIYEKRFNTFRKKELPEFEL